MKNETQNPIADSIAILDQMLEENARQMAALENGTDATLAHAESVTSALGEIAGCFGDGMDAVTAHFATEGTPVDTAVAESITIIDRMLEENAQQMTDLQNGDDATLAYFDTIAGHFSGLAARFGDSPEAVDVAPAPVIVEEVAEPAATVAAHVPASYSFNHSDDDVRLFWDAYRKFLSDVPQAEFYPHEKHVDYGFTELYSENDGLFSKALNIHVRTQYAPLGPGTWVSAVQTKKGRVWTSVNSVYTAGDFTQPAAELFNRCGCCDTARMRYLYVTHDADGATTPMCGKCLDKGTSRSQYGTHRATRIIRAGVDFDKVAREISEASEEIFDTVLVSHAAPVVYNTVMNFVIERGGTYEATDREFVWMYEDSIADLDRAEFDHELDIYDFYDFCTTGGRRNNVHYRLYSNKYGPLSFIKRICYAMWDYTMYLLDCCKK